MRLKVETTSNLGHIVYQAQNLNETVQLSIKISNSKFHKKEKRFLELPNLKWFSHFAQTVKTRQEGGPSSWKCQDFVVLLRRKDNCIKVRLPMENKPTPLPLFAFVFFSICALEQMRFFCCYCCSLPNCPDSLSWELNQSKKCDKCNIFRLCSWVPRVQISLLHRLLRSL